MADNQVTENGVSMNGDAELCLPNNTESPSPAGGSQKDESEMIFC